MKRISQEDRAATRQATIAAVMTLLSEGSLPSQRRTAIDIEVHAEAHSRVAAPEESAQAIFRRTFVVKRVWDTSK